MRIHCQGNVSNGIITHLRYKSIPFIHLKTRTDIIKIRTNLNAQKLLDKSI
jgi:hypothetical protein